MNVRRLLQSMLFVSAASLFACQTDGNDAAPENPSEATPELQNQPITPEIQEKRRSRLNRCPHLIQKRVDSTQVIREDSITQNACDYFIYPTIGETVSVRVSDARMKPVLLLPYTHDFANGDYHVISNGRHIIHLEYDAFGSRPDVMNYVIEVEILPAMSQ